MRIVREWFKQEGEKCTDSLLQLRSPNHLQLCHPSIDKIHVGSRINLTSHNFSIASILCISITTSSQLNLTRPTLEFHQHTSPGHLRASSADQPMLSSEPYNGTGVQYYTIPSFTFSASTTLPIKVAYRVYDPSHNAVSKGTILIPTCYGGHINTTLTFNSGSLTALTSYTVIVVAMLGNSESSSPSNDPYFPPHIRYEDCIRAQYELLTKELKAKELEAVIGFSMGGQQAYYWTTTYPSLVKNAVCICGSTKTSAHNIAFLEGPKTVLLNSSDCADGAYKTRGIKPERGLRAFGRAWSAWLTSAAWWREGHWKRVGANGGSSSV
jgi:homoserine acetyltransferase